MNKPSPERDLLEQALAAMTAHGLRSRIVEAEGPLKDATRPGATVEIGRDGEVVKYAVEVKRRVGASNIGPIVHDLRGRPDAPLLVTRHVTPPVAMQLREQGVQFIDTAGNASLSNRAFMVWVKGEKPGHPVSNHDTSPPSHADSGRAFQPRGLQVVFTLLSDPQRINKPFRELARMSGVANGTVASVIAGLEHGGFVPKLSSGHGSRRMFELKELLRQWTDAYARTLRPRTLLARYYASGAEDWTKWNLGGDALWGGEPAAALVNRHLVPGELTIYAEKTPAQLVARQHLLKTAEPGHAKPVEFRRRFWNFASEAPLETLHATVPPLLVYADLLAVGDARCLEAATILYEDRIARSIEQ